MAQPTLSAVHIDRPLTNFSTAYVQDQTAFIASKVFPNVPVTNKSDSYYIYTKADWFRDEAQIRPPATESAGSGYNLSTTTYNCDVYALHKDIPDQVTANEDAILNGEQDASVFLTERMLLKHEVEWASTFFTTSVWGTDVTPTLWSSYATSTPMTDVQTGRTTILKNTGKKPNTMVVGYDVYSALLNHPDILARISGVSADVITTDVMARYFQVDRFFVCEAVKNAGNEGETDSYGFVQGKHALLCYVAPTVGPRTATAGVTFSWDGVSDGTGGNVGIARFEMPLKRATRIESQMAWDSKVIGADLGYFFASVVS